MASNRRTFLQQASAGIVATAAIGHAVAQENSQRKIRIGAIGCGGQGTGLANAFAGLADVEVAYVCDPDDARAQRAAEIVANRGGKAPKVVNDLRRILDDQSIDAVTVATPDHWHAPAAILACAAGKHVYVEKPCSHNVREGRWLVEAAQRHRRIVQHGTQSRSSGLINHAVELLRSGIIGDVLVAKAWNVQQRGNIGHASPTQPPAGFDYDVWLGPAPHVPFQSNRHHYTWHWWYDFGTGDTGNDGVHEIDIARWGLGVDTHPSLISACGGKSFFDDDQQFPDTQYASFLYPGDGQLKNRRQLVWEMRLWSRYGLEGVDNGNAFYGTDGWMLLSKRGILKVFDRSNKPVAIDGSPEDRPNHQQDFVNAIREERPPSASIEIGHVSSTLCHLANIATRVGRSLNFDPATEAVIGDDEAHRLLGRSYRDDHWARPGRA